jgi:DNA-binding transcriptional ArsR family regulator
VGDNASMTERADAGDGDRGPTDPQLHAAASTFALLSSPVRLHLVWLASQNEHDVGTLAQQAGVTVASASQQLTKLRLAGIVATRSSGRRHIYTVEDPHILTLIGQIFDHIAPDGTLAPDPPTISTGAR